MKVLIIIPAYNEDENIIKLIKIIQKEHANINIILIDDSNNFTTKRNIENYKFSNLKYIKRNMKMGRGSAIRYGFEYANKHSFDYTIEMDSDRSHDPNEIKFLLQKITNKNYDLVIGSRYLKKSKIIGWPIKRKIFSKIILKNTEKYSKEILSLPINQNLKPEQILWVCKQINNFYEEKK